MAARTTYVPNDWSTGDLITEEGLDHIEQGIYNIDLEISDARGDEDTLVGKIETKVDKIDGKGLSANDFTDEEKTKLRNLDLTEIANLRKYGIFGYPTMITNADNAYAYFQNSMDADNAPVNTFAMIGMQNQYLNILHLPAEADTIIGTLFTFVFNGSQNDASAKYQLYITRNGVNVRSLRINVGWTEWTDNVSAVNNTIAALENTVTQLSDNHDNLEKLSIVGHPTMISNANIAKIYFGDDMDVNNAPVNEFCMIGGGGLGIKNLPGGSDYIIGTLFTFVFNGNQDDTTSKFQMYVTREGINIRHLRINTGWSAWTDNAAAINNNISTLNSTLSDLDNLVIKGYPTQISNVTTAQNYFGTNLDANDAPVNTFAMIGAWNQNLGIQHLPAEADTVVGTLFTFVHNGNQNDVAAKFQIYVSRNGINVRHLRYNIGWTEWTDNATKINEMVSTINNEISNLNAGMLSQYKGCKFSLIGDSITAYGGYVYGDYHYYYPTSDIPDVTDVNQTWWMRVINACGGSLEVNASYAGSMATNRHPEYPTNPTFYMRRALLGNPDIIFVALGTNDGGIGQAPLGEYDFETNYTELSESDFRPAYIKGVKALQDIYPDAEIVLVKLKMRSEYASSIQYIGDTMGLTVITASDYVGGTTPENVHPGDYGMNQIAEMVKGGLISKAALSQRKAFDNKLKYVVKSYPQMIYNVATAQAYFGENLDANDAPVNTLAMIGAQNLNILNMPSDANSVVGSLVTFIYNNKQNDTGGGKFQLYITRNGINVRSFRYNVGWTPWTDNITALLNKYNELKKLSIVGVPDSIYNASTAYTFFQNSMDANNAPVNTFALIAATGLEIQHLPGDSDYIVGTLFTFIYNGNQNDTVAKFQVYVSRNGINVRHLRINTGWTEWTDNATEINDKITNTANQFTTQLENLRNLAIVGHPVLLHNVTNAKAYFGDDMDANNAPVNTFAMIGAQNLGIQHLPDEAATVIGTLFTFVYNGNQADMVAKFQAYVSRNGISVRQLRINVGWTEWTSNAAEIDSAISEINGSISTINNNISTLTSNYNTLERASITGYTTMITNETNARAYFVGSTMNANDAPVNTFAMIGATGLAIENLPNGANYTIGTLYTSVFSGSQTASNSKIQMYVDERGISTRMLKNTGWTKWSGPEEIYYIGPDEAHTSFAGLLVDLNSNENKKIIYIREGVYDVFSEYRALVNAGKLQEPPADVTSPNYLYPLNAFIPNNTHIIGLGNVILRWRPSASEITYDESRTWSPLNVNGNVVIENITVDVKNARYCLHNDDKAYNNATQIYKNCKFLYELSDYSEQKPTERLGFNINVGFGINAGCTNIYEDCEFYNNGGRNSFYGHNASAGKGCRIIVKNSILTNSVYGVPVIRLQTLSHAQSEKVQARFENCYINGNLELNMYYTDSKQAFETTFVNCNTITVNRTIASGGTIVDPYTVKQYNPLGVATSANPMLIES